MSVLPPPSVMYRAVAARDGSFQGVFYVAVRTTGVFCRPGCPARTPLERNVQFFATVRECLESGYRPCRRCRPLDADPDAPPWLRGVLELAESQVERRITATDLRAAGAEPVAVARYFRRRYGLTFQAFHRARRVGVGLAEIRSGATLGAAADATGFESESGFRSAFVSVFGAAPSRLPRDRERPYVARWIATPLGSMLAIAGDDGLAMLEFVDRRGLPRELERFARRTSRLVIPGANEHLDATEEWLGRYFDGDMAIPPVVLSFAGSPFQCAVWAALREIPAGSTRSYGEVARLLGRPSAVRAVARANGANQLSIVVPCHRVIGADGSPTGYGGGLWRKRWLLDHERASVARAAAARVEPGHRVRRTHDARPDAVAAPASVAG